MKNIDQSLLDMKNYILENSIIDNINNPEYEYCLCVYTNTIFTLYLAARLIRSLSIKARSIGRMQTVYKSCNYDCIDIAKAFEDIRNINDYNASIITVFDTHGDINDDDFYITVISRKKNSNENNNIAVGIDWKHFYHD